jgi:secreted trypsin-like serine protease
MGRVRSRHLPGLSALLVLLAVLLVSPGTEASEPPARIVGGELTTTEKYPFAVALLDFSGRQFCGGSLVAADKVLTAAHCASGAAQWMLKVVVGRTDLRTREGTVAGVRSIWIHPRYRSFEKGYDVAVLALNTSVSGTPVPLIDGGDRYRAGRQGTILGWGGVQEGAPRPSDVLRRGQVPLVADKTCSRAYPTLFLPTHMVCAGYARGGVDTCQGDSGGPLIVDGVLVGVTSFGTGCARPNRYGVYTRLLSYESELRAQIKS